MPRPKRRSTSSDATLTDACRALLAALEADLRASLAEQPEVEAAFRAEHAEAVKRTRTGHGWSTWLDERLTQIGASWILSCLFVRVVEDRGLVDPLISGRKDDDPRRSRLEIARHAELEYLGRHPTHGAAEWLQQVFRTHAELPGLAELLDERHALLWRLSPTPEGARALIDFWRELDSDADQVRWLFERPEHANSGSSDTRFLGDLYQDLSESARKAYALLQTPEFVEEFILDRTLEPAIATFGLPTVRLIDPTCGSGHFLLGAFKRLLRHWSAREPGTDVRERVKRSLDAVAGVDINPFAASIARFRLLIEALDACGITRLADAPRFPIQVVTGDSLLHGDRAAVGGPLRGVQQEFDPEHALGHFYRHEVPAELRSVLERQYHAVVGNPPYITPKDKAANAAYRERFGSCAGKYALSVPFMERFVELALSGGEGTAAGYVGQITSNSFMKREFGKQLIEEFMPRWDLTTVIDTSGAYIPGHNADGEGTTTTILLMRNQRPTSPTVRAVLGIRSEPGTPADAARGLVWRAILGQVDRPGSQSEFVSVDDRAREAFQQHPWSIGGGGAAELVEQIGEASLSALSSSSDSIGITCFTLEDDAFVRPALALSRYAPRAACRPLVEGDLIRDWSLQPADVVVFPYDEQLFADTSRASQPIRCVLWPCRTTLSNNLMFGGRTKVDDGVAWFEFGRFTSSKYRVPLSITFAFVATHNHFVLDRGGKVFKQTAPVIKLPADGTETEHLALLELLNSSLACFWGRQKYQPKGGFADGKWEERLEWDSTKLATFPLPGDEHTWKSHGRYATQLDALATHRAGRLPSAERVAAMKDLPTALAADQAEADLTLRRMIAVQEELDWAIYRAYGLLDDDSLELPGEPPPIALGERAFEIVMARQIARGELSTTWFERHGSTAITEIPDHWPAAYRDLVQRRIGRLTQDRNIALIERPECKRRWNSEPWADLLASALRDALLDRIEAQPDWRAEHPAPLSAVALADRLERDDCFMRMLREYTRVETPNVAAAIAELVASESVPFLPALRFTAPGLRKHAEWLECWREQRIEDPYLERMEFALGELFGQEPSAMARARKLLVRWRAKHATALHAEKPEPDRTELARRAEILARHEAIDLERRRALDLTGERATPIVPPKYKASDFSSTTFWKLRGALDVPKERFIAYSTRGWSLGAPSDPTPLIGWAGWSHAQQAAALARLLEDRVADGWRGDQLTPILQGMSTLLPWLAQWHASDAHGDLGAAYAGWLEQKMIEHGVTRAMIEAWQPPVASASRRKRAPAT